MAFATADASKIRTSVTWPSCALVTAIVTVMFAALELVNLALLHVTGTVPALVVTVIVVGVFTNAGAIRIPMFNVAAAVIAGMSTPMKFVSVPVTVGAVILNAVAVVTVVLAPTVIV